MKAATEETPVNSQTRDELLQSAHRKWASLARNPLQKEVYCGLCQQFISAPNSKKIDCNGCPVKDDTGVPLCLATPYVKWAVIHTQIAKLQRFEKPVPAALIADAKGAAREMGKYILGLIEKRRGG